MLLYKSYSIFFSVIHGLREHGQLSLCINWAITPEELQMGILTTLLNGAEKVVKNLRSLSEDVRVIAQKELVAGDRFVLLPIEAGVLEAAVFRATVGSIGSFYQGRVFTVLYVGEREIDSKLKHWLESGVSQLWLAGQLRHVVVDMMSTGGVVIEIV